MELQMGRFCVVQKREKIDNIYLIEDASFFLTTPQSARVKRTVEPAPNQAVEDTSVDIINKVNISNDSENTAVLGAGFAWLEVFSHEYWREKWVQI